MDWITQALEQINPLDRLRRAARAHEMVFIAIALVIGLLSGVATVGQGLVAHGLQQWFFDLTPGAHLSASAHVPLSRLLVLPLGGLALGVFAWVVRTRMHGRTMVDAVEANALHGGRMSMRDSLVVSGQTLLSNGCGASVGLEAAYVQMGSGVASAIGRGLHLRRADLRTLVGAGAGAAIAAAFGAPLTGAFYAFEIVMGIYTPAALAPVAVACLAAVSVALALGYSPYFIAVPPIGGATSRDYLLCILLAAICTAVGIALIRAVAMMERRIALLGIPLWLRPALGGLLLVPMAAWMPQVLSAGHGAMSTDMVVGYSLTFIAVLFVVKSVASAVSLGFGFRGGLFFASLFLGALLGHLFSGLAEVIVGHPLLSRADAAVIGMASLAVAVVGGPLTMSMLVLETTHDFALTSIVVAAALICNTLVRNTFGYSFSTWRLHLRGETIKSARDIGWAKGLDAGQLMRAEFRSMPAATTLADFRGQFPLGSASRVVLVDAQGDYAGIVSPVAAHAATLDPMSPVAQIARNRDRFVRTQTDILEIMKAFDAAQADELAVVDAAGRTVGLLTEAHVRRRYAEELEKGQRELFGER